MPPMTTLTRSSLARDFDFHLAHPWCTCWPPAPGEWQAAIVFLEQVYRKGIPAAPMELVPSPWYMGYAIFPGYLGCAPSVRYCLFLPTL